MQKPASLVVSAGVTEVTSGSRNLIGEEETPNNLSRVESSRARLQTPAGDRWGHASTASSFQRLSLGLVYYFFSICIICMIVLGIGGTALVTEFLYESFSAGAQNAIVR